MMWPFSELKRLRAANVRLSEKLNASYARIAELEQDIESYEDDIAIQSLRERLNTVLIERDQLRAQVEALDEGYAMKK